MNPDPLPPIPSPPAHHWRQFRVNVLPFIAFGIVLVIVVWLWGKNQSNPVLAGQAEGLEADVASPRAGRISHLNVVLYQEVKAGDVIAIVEASDPMILSNSMNLARAEMAAIRVDGGFRPTDKVRYSQFEFAWLKLRAELASEKAQLSFAEMNFQRYRKLFESKLESEETYQYWKGQYETYLNSYNDKLEVVAAMEAKMKEVSPASSEDSKYVNAAIAVAEEKFKVLEAELAPITLVAPVSGRVRSLAKLSGATVSTGDPIVTISSSKVDRIVGFLSQPMRFEPKVGEKVTVRCRGLERNQGAATITHIGPRVELFDSPLRVRGMGTAQQRGLPIIVSVPSNLKLLPGEIVDLTIDTRPDKGS